jgi:hypothetical protein
MRRVKKENILISSDQVPQGKTVDDKTASNIVNNVHKKQKEILAKKPLRFPYA